MTNVNLDLQSMDLIPLTSGESIIYQGGSMPIEYEVGKAAYKVVDAAWSFLEGVGDAICS